VSLAHIMSFFTVVSFFALANRTVPGTSSFFYTTIMCAGNPAAVPVDLCHYCAANEAAIADNTVVLITAKVFSPGHIVSSTYTDHVPSPRPPNVFADGTVTDSHQTCDDPIATFVITVPEFVHLSPTYAASPSTTDSFINTQPSLPR
jgi:hypothetical protein